jgi:hypothetical protein
MKELIYTADYSIEGDFENLGTITGDSLKAVVDQAKKLNFICKDECYNVRSLEWSTSQNEWDTIEFYDFELNTIS